MALKISIDMDASPKPGYEAVLCVAVVLPRDQRNKAHATHQSLGIMCMSSKRSTVLSIGSGKSTLV